MKTAARNQKSSASSRTHSEMRFRRIPVSIREVRIFCHTLRVRNPTNAEWFQVF